MPSAAAVARSAIAAARRRLGGPIRLEAVLPGRESGLHRFSAALVAAATVDEVAEAVLVHVTTLLGCDAAIVSLVDGDGRLWRFPGRGLAHDAAGRVTGQRVDPTVDPPLTRSMDTAEPQAFQTREAFAGAFPDLAALPGSLGLRSALVYPLCAASGRVMGVVVTGFAAAHSATPRRSARLAQVAQQAAVAFDRASTLERQQTDARHLAQLQRVTSGLAVSPRPEDVAMVVAEVGRDVVGAAVGLVYAKSDGSTLELLAGSGSETVPIVARRLAADDASPAWDAMRAGCITGVDDEAEVRRRYPPSSGWAQFSSVLAVPVVLAGEPAGAIVYAYDEGKGVPTAALKIAQTVAEQFAQALERARLHSRAERNEAEAVRRHDQLRALMSALQDGVFMADAAGAMIDVNDRFCDITGFTRDQIIGARPPYPWWPKHRMDAAIPYLTSLGQRLERGDTALGEFEVTFEHREGSLVVALASLSAIRGPDGRRVGTAGTVKDIGARVRAEHRLRVLQRITAGMAAAQTVADIGRVAVDEALPALGATAGGLFVRSRDGEHVELVHVRETVPGSATRWRSFRYDESTPVASAMRSGETLQRQQAPDGTDALLASMGVRHAVWVPVMSPSAGPATGCLTLLFRDPRQLDDNDLSLFTAIAQQCGLALDRATAMDAEQESRRLAERSDERTRKLQSATAALSVAAEPLDAARALVEHAAALVGADGVALYMLRRQQAMLELIDTGTALERASRLARSRVPLAGPYAMCDAARRAEPIWIPDRAEWAVRYPAAQSALGRHEAAGLVPLCSGDQVLGVLVVMFDAPQLPTGDDQSLVATLAELGAQSLERARQHEAQRVIARTLQQSLLPLAVETGPASAMAVEYRPAVDMLQVGGDWYDVIVTEQRVIVTVGDVVGRGLAAAAAMGQLRNALAALSVNDDDPALVLERLDPFAQRVEGGEAATAAYASLDPHRGVLRYARAGHPPPVLLSPGGHAVLLEDGGSHPLGAGIETARRVGAAVRLRPGSAIVLYTDGLVERRGTSLDSRLEQLVDVVASSPAGDPDAICHRLLEAMAADQDLTDDVAVLCLAFDPARDQHLHWRFPASFEWLRDARGVVRRWLSARGIVGDDADDLVLACDEACANAIEHGAGSAPDAEIELEMSETAGGVTVEVRDPGSWSTDRQRRGGHGLTLMRALSTSLHIDRSTGGSTVTMHKSTGRSEILNQTSRTPAGA